MTVAFNTPNLQARNTQAAQKSIVQQPKTTEQIVKEEIQRQKKLDALEEQYENGEITKLDYNIQKAILTSKLGTMSIPKPTSCCHCNYVA